MHSTKTRRGDLRSTSAALVLALLLACSRPGPDAIGEAWPEADAIFASDPRWVGGDGAFSVDLGAERLLWLFGDSFIAREPYERDGAMFINNSMAIQTGLDPTTAAIRFYWRTNDDGSATAIAGGGEGYWLWPEHGARIGDGALLFYEEVRTPPGREPGPGAFEGIGWTAFWIPDVSGSPDTWTLEELDCPETGEVMLGEAVLVEDPWFYAYGTDDGVHSLSLARWPLEEVATGDLSSLQWWCGDAWCEGEPSSLIGIAAPELSIHYDAGRDEYLMVQTTGFAAATLAIRSAPEPQGPWSSSRDVYRPPYSYYSDAEVYAGKAHPLLQGADLVATYVDGKHYLPQFVRITFR